MKDYADMWHFIMDTSIDVINRKYDELEAADKIMDKFAELLSNNGMNINDIPTVKER